MAMSVNTNVGAMIALQNLNATNKALETTQLRVTTGLKVNGPKDDAAMGFGRVGVGSKGRLGIVGQDLNLRPSGYEPDCDGILCIRGDDGRPPPLRRGRAGADLRSSAVSEKTVTAIACRGW